MRKLVHRIARPFLLVIAFQNAVDTDDWVIMSTRIRRGSWDTSSDYLN